MSGNYQSVNQSIINLPPYYNENSKQDACSGVHSACLEENGHKWAFMYHCSGRGKNEVAN